MASYRGAVRIKVDHDHETGYVRGLLCNRCNWLVGILDLDPNLDLFYAAVQYVQRAAETQKLDKTG